MPVRPEHDRVQSCAIALRSPASERSSGLKRCTQGPVFSPCSSSSHSSGTRSCRGRVDRFFGKHARAAPTFGCRAGCTSIHQDDGVRKSPAVIQQQRFKAACTCQARRRPGSPALQPCARSVCPAATSGVPHVPRAFAPVQVRHGYAFTEARVRLTGVPSPQTCVPSPLTFPPRRASNVLPEPAPLAAAGGATSTAVVVLVATAAAATRVGGRHHRNRAHIPHFVPDHMAGAPT